MYFWIGVMIYVLSIFLGCYLDVKKGFTSPVLFWAIGSWGALLAVIFMGMK